MAESRVPGPGRPRRMSRELLLQAGALAVQTRASSNQRLEDVLGVRLREIAAAADAIYLKEHDEIPNPPMSSAAVYRLWSDKEDYLQDVFASMFQPPTSEEVGQQLLGRADEPWEEVLGSWARSDQAHAALLGPVYLLAFVAAAGDDGAAREAVRNVYRAFDAAIVPVLRQFFAEHGLVVHVPGSTSVDGIPELAQMLTAVTEGWFLRNIADPPLSEAVSLWATQAVLVVRGATMPSPEGFESPEPA